MQTQATGINNAGYTTGFWSDTNLGSGDAKFAFLRAPIGHNFTYASTIDPNTASVPRVSQALGLGRQPGKVYAHAVDLAGTMTGKGRPSFLKKRSKKLLLSGHGPDAWRPWPENKSLLLLFFRKEDLACLGVMRREKGGM